MKQKSENRKRTLAAAALLCLASLGFYHGGHAYKERFLGVVQPRSSGAIQSSPWGIQIGSLESEHVIKASEIGVKWTRLMLSWNQVENKKGEYDWSETDSAFAIALRNGITPFVCLAGANKLYSEPSATDKYQEEIYGKSTQPPTKSAEAMNAWLAFVKKAVTRYKGKIVYWEVWNEPNHPHYWGAKPDGKEYGVLVKETALAIKSIDESAKVLGGALAGLDPEFTNDFLSNGTAKLIDIISFHNYSELPEDRIYKAAEVWKVIEKHNPALELWQGECGYPSHSNTRDYRGTSPWGVFIQAKWLLRQSFTDVYYCKTTLSNYFKLVHQGGRGQRPKRSSLTALDSLLGFPAKGGSRVKSIGVNEKCILENPTLAPKRAYYSYQNLCAVFDNRYKPVSRKSSVTIIESGCFYGIGSEDDAFPSIPLVTTFQSGDGNYLLAYWLPWHPQEIIDEATISLTVNNVSFADPVLVDLLTGKAFAVSGSKSANGDFLFKNIPLADYPFAIVEKSQLTLK